MVPVRRNQGNMDLVTGKYIQCSSSKKKQPFAYKVRQFFLTTTNKYWRIIFFEAKAVFDKEL